MYCSATYKETQLSHQNNNVQVWPRKNALSLMYHHFATVRCIICCVVSVTWLTNKRVHNHVVCSFAPKGSAKISAYYSNANLCQWFKLFDKQQQLDTCHQWCHSACKQDTSNCWKLSANKDFANWIRLDCWQNDCRVYSKCCLILYE